MYFIPHIYEDSRAYQGTRNTILIRYAHLEDTKWAITTLFFAASTGDESLVRTVLEHTIKFSDGARLQNCQKSGYRAVGRGSIPAAECFEEMVDFILLDSTALAIEDGMGTWGTALHWGVREKQLALLRSALENGADPGQTNYLGETALHTAVKTNDGAAARILLEWCADVEASDANGMTPIDIARRFFAWNSKVTGWEGGCIGISSAALIQLLLENSMNNNFRDKEGVPLLHLAVIFNHMVLIQDLLDSCAQGNDVVDINVRDTDGKTALHVAAKAGNLVVVKALLKNGAYPGAIDRVGRTPFDMARGRVRYFLGML